MFHEQFDLEFFTSLFPLDRLRAEAKNQYCLPGGEIITSPSHISTVEQLRSELLANEEQPISKPTDVFIFADGEPQSRVITKVGGLPYWPKGIQWPRNNYGIDLTFVGQICYADSRDIIDDIPGDVLLIFVCFERLEQNPDDQTAIQFHWRNIRDDELIELSDIPSPEIDIRPKYGIRHRTQDFVEELSGATSYSRHWLLSRIQGTKIGGLPNWIQTDSGLPGEFLGSLGSISPDMYVPYPYVNTPEPLTEIPGDGELMWYDVGSLYINIYRPSKLWWTIQSY